MEKHRKISLVMSFMFIFSIIFSGNTKVQAAVEDNIVPIVKNVSVDKREAAKGNTILVTVDAEDNSSGLAQEANLCYVTKTESGEVEKGIKLSLVDGKYVGEINIDRSYSLGTWKISFITVQDNQKNVSVVYNSRVHTKLTSMSATVQNLNGGDFEILDIEDRNAPQFKGITVSDNEIEKYDNVKIVVDASDDLSGLAQEANLCYISKANGKEVEKEVSLALVNGKYEGNITIDDSYGTGNWLVSFITMQDKDGNVNAIYNAEVHPKIGQDLSSANLYLNEDIMSPEFKGVAVDYNFNISDSKLNIEVKAADSNSGLADEANLCYVSQKDGKAVEKEVTLKLQDGKYVASVVMDDGLKAANWKISFIALQDKAGNVDVVYNSDIHPGLGQSLATADLKLNGDVTAPKFEGISVNYGYGINNVDEAIFEVKALDDISGLAEEASLCYVSQKDGKVVEKEITLKLENEKYVARVAIDDSFTVGTWKPSFITLQDKVGNVAIIYNSDVHVGLGENLSQANISLQGDITAPKFEGISVDYSYGINNVDQAIFEVKASDDISGLAEEASLCYVSQKDGKVVEKEVTLKLEQGRYVGNLIMDDSIKGANWRASFIILEDKVGNVDVIYNSDVHIGLGQSLKAADITLNGDITAPKFESISVAGNNVGKFDSVIVEVKASDEMSGLAEEANLCYVSQKDGKAVEKEITLKLEDGKYVGLVTMDETYGDGTWKASFITLQDKVGNVTVIYNSNIHPGLGQDLKAADITLNGDVSGPEFKDISVNTNQINLYDNVVVEVKASDDMSGLAEEANLCYVSELDGKVVEKEVTLKLEEGRYVGALAIDETYGIGTWEVSFITLQDKVGNVSIIYNKDIHKGLGTDLSKADLSAKVDGAYLVFNKVNVSTQKAFLGDKVEVVVEATNKVAELKETADLCYVLTTPFGDIEREVTLNLVDGKYQGTIDIDQSYYSGLWRISFITIGDKKGNVIVVYNNRLHGGIGTNLSSGDINTLTDVVVEPLNEEEEFKLGTTVEIKARVTNGLDRAQKATLIVGLYDKENRLIKYETISEEIDSRESSELVVPVIIPEKDVCKLKIFVWDSIEGMTPLSNSREYLVK